MTGRYDWELSASVAAQHWSIDLWINGNTDDSPQRMWKWQTVQTHTCTYSHSQTGRFRRSLRWARPVREDIRAETVSCDTVWHQPVCQMSFPYSLHLWQLMSKVNRELFLVSFHTLLCFIVPVATDTVEWNVCACPLSSFIHVLIYYCF